MKGERMERIMFFDLIEHYFQYLINDYGFSVIAKEVYPNFDNAEMILQSNGCRIRVLRERGQVFVDVGPLPPRNNWYDLATLIAYLTRGANTWEYKIPDHGDYEYKVEWQVMRLADILRPYCAQICKLFHKGIMEQTCTELKEFMDQQFRKKWGQYIVKG